MTDVHSEFIRSYNMSQIRSKDTKPELIIRKFLFKNGYRFRLHDKKMPGKPDLVLKKISAVIFVHGCFWHGHKGCKYFVVPKTRTDWWLEKINRNKDNDKNNKKNIKKLSWKIITIWECEIKPSKREKTLLKLLKTLQNTVK